MTVPTAGFRRLALWTAVATFLLIVLGGVVRVSDSGLGCGPGGSGVEGWPLCNGDIIPGFSLNTAIEFSHRVVASLVGIMIIALAVLAWRRHRAHRGLVRATAGGVVLVIAQGLLGAATVEKDLDESLVAAHLGLAMLLFAIAIYVVRASRAPAEGVPAVDGGPRFRPLALGSAALLLGTIVAGGYMAGTERRGASDQHVSDGAHHACGTDFPSCNDGFLPFGANRFVDIHLTHRVFVYLFTIAAVALIVLAVRRRASEGVVRFAWVMAGLLVVQLGLGAANVWISREIELLILAHLATATLLWGALTALTLELFAIPAPATEAARRVGEREAVAA